MPSEVILASAGTGKTHALTTRYIRLLAQCVPTRQILATTFTRKAAAEILTRIVSRLEIASRDEALASDMGLTRSIAGNLLCRFSREAHQASIGTLDSFFSRITGAAGVDVGLSPAWEVVGEEEDARLRAEAVERCVEESDEDEFYALMGLLHNGGFPSRVLDSMLRTITSAYDVFTSSPHDAWTAIDGPGHLRGANLSDPEIDSRIRLVMACELPLTKKGLPDGRWVKALAATEKSLREKDWESFLESGLGAAFVRGEYYGTPMPGALTAALSPLVLHASALLIGQECRIVHAMRRLLERFDAMYRSLKSERGAYRFDDIPRAILESTFGADPARLYERMDARTDHVLLDEFQDTSRTQFLILRPMLEELVSGLGASEGEAGRSIFCVGDDKQCLYQWRDAAPELLATLPRLWKQLEVRRLDASFRSSRVVLDAVNRVFGGIGANAALLRASEPSVARAAVDWQERFHEHVPMRDLPGLVRVRWCERNEKGETNGDSTMRAAAESVALLHAAQPRASIGILTSRRVEVARIMFELKNLGIDASEEGGNPVTDSAAPSVALSMLHLADHPSDTAARFHVATSPLGPVVGLTDFRDEAMCERACSAVRSKVAYEGFGATLAAWLASIAAQCDRREYERFGQLVDLGREFDARRNRPEPSRLERFVEFARVTKIEDPRSAMVRVMTVHASKGLEFDAVVLPTLHRTLPGRTPGLLATSDGPLKPPSVVFTYPRKLLRSIDPRLDELYQQWRHREMTEDLCVLYVAMTRARHALELYVPREDTLSLGAIVREALRPADNGLAIGDDRWHERIEWKPHAGPDTEPIHIRLKA